MNFFVYDNAENRLSIDEYSILLVKEFKDLDKTNINEYINNDFDVLCGIYKIEIYIKYYINYNYNKMCSNSLSMFI